MTGTTPATAASKRSCTPCSRAGSTPPITSTIRSEAARISSKSPRERVSTPASSGRSPVTGTIASARSSSSRANADPTVPWPSSPTLNVSGTQVLVGLAPHYAARVAARAEDHRRARHAVVVVGHRVSVGAGDRGHDDVAGPGVGQVRVLDQDVAGLAVLAD